MLLFDETTANRRAFENAPAALVPEFVPSKTAEELICAMCFGETTEMRLLILMGPRGEGKTTSGLYSCQALAESLLATGLRNLLPIRVAVVRDTWVNLARTTIASFEENQRRGMPIEWRDGKREAIISEKGQEFLHFYFFGMDSRDDADKLQGFQCGILWLEEVAPAAELAAGMPPETLGIGGTSLRQPGIPRRILVTMNPPDEEHWIMSVEKTLGDLGLDEISVHRFVIPEGEKARHFRTLATRPGITSTDSKAWTQAADEFDAYRKTNEALLLSINRQDLVARLVKGQIGGVTIGEALVPEFGYTRHTTTDWLPILPGIDIIRCWDFGLTPSTVWFQVTPSGNVNIIGSRLSVNRAVGQHIIEEVLPFQEKYKLFPKRPTYERGMARGYTFRDIGDPAGVKGNEQTKAEETAVWVIESLLKTSFEPGPVAWSARRAALKMAFYRPGQGDRALVRIYRPECGTLVKALNGKAHYPTDARTGRILETVEAAKKASGLFFQELDALAYGFAQLMPAEEWLKQAVAPHMDTRRHKPRSWVGV
jgi:hypothetical protein